MKLPIKNTSPHRIVMNLNSHLTYGPECLTNSADITPLELAKTKVKKLTQNLMISLVKLGRG
jgi:hypothetical protein